MGEPYAASGVDYYSLKCLTDRRLHPDRPAARPPKNGRFMEACLSRQPVTAPGGCDTYEYSLSSLHFPPGHSYFNYTGNPPWFARVVIELNNTDIFASWDFDWMNRMEEHRWKDVTEIDHDVLSEKKKGLAMYVRRMDLAFLAEYPSKKGDGSRERNLRNSWHVSVSVYSTEKDHLDFEISRLRNIISKETCVSLEARRHRDPSNPLIPFTAEDSFYLLEFQAKKPQPRDVWRSWAADNLESYNARLWDIVDLHFERQLYGLEPEGDSHGERKPMRKRYRKKNPGSELPPSGERLPLLIGET